MKKAMPRVLSQRIEFLVANNQGRQISAILVGTNKTEISQKLNREIHEKDVPRKLAKIALNSGGPEVHIHAQGCSCRRNQRGYL